MSFKTRNQKTAPPSGGYGISAPIGGMGKLLPGTYTCEVVSKAEEPGRTLLLLAAQPGGEIHSDWYQWIPKWVQTGMKLQCTVEYGPGYIVAKQGTEYQAVSPDTKEPMSEWVHSLHEIYEGMYALGFQPADTKLTELTHNEHGKYRPKVYTPEASEPNPQAPDSKTK